ncbi:MAG: hypothetical protein U5K31_12830 [Balneolaceae bacterium]|nr:hypothetical protein [Balneolaceae bacterium]
MSYSRHSLKKALQNQVRRLSEAVQTLEERSKRLSTLRLLTFLGGMGLIYVAARTDLVWLFVLCCLAFAGSFAALVLRHRAVDDACEKARIWKELREKHLHRMELDWEGIPAPEATDPDADHPFARDLNLAGLHSLHHLSDTTIYRGAARGCWAG